MSSRGRPRDPEAPSREGAQAPLRLSALRSCSAATGFPARRTSTPSTGAGAPCRAVPGPALVPARRRADGDPRLGLAVPRAVGSAVARNRVKRLLRESWRDLLPPYLPAATTSWSLGPASPSRPRRAARVARRRDRRRPREGRHVRYAGIGLVLRLAVHVRAPDARRDLQVPPELLAVRDRRAPRVRARPGHGARGLARSCAATRGVTAAWTTHATSRSSRCVGRRPARDRRRPSHAAREHPHGGPQVVPRDGPA